MWQGLDSRFPWGWSSFFLCGSTCEDSRRTWRCCLGALSVCSYDCAVPWACVAWAASSLCLAVASCARQWFRSFVVPILSCLHSSPDPRVWPNFRSLAFRFWDVFGYFAQAACLVSGLILRTRVGLCTVFSGIFRLQFLNKHIAVACRCPLSWSLWPMPLSWLLPCPILPLKSFKHCGKRRSRRRHVVALCTKPWEVGWRTTENRHSFLRGIMVAAHRKGMDGKGSSKFQTRFAPWLNLMLLLRSTATDLFPVMHCSCLDSPSDLSLPFGKRMPMTMSGV